MESNTVRINIVIYAESESDATSLASKLFATQTDNVYSHTFEGVQVRGYIRYPGGVGLASPSGITDALVVHVNSAGSEHWESVKAYIDSRRGIPYKFLTSVEDLSQQAGENQVEFVSLNDLVNSAQDRLFRPSLNLEQTLRNTFDKIDTDHDGYLEANEILAASVELGHAINDEEAKEIVDSLSSDGKVSFDRFKQWWVMGRGDFNSFRKLVQVEMKVHDLIKQSSTHFNTYLEKIKSESQTESSQAYVGRYNLVSSEDFQAGVALSLHKVAGTNFQTISSVLPSYLRESPVSFGVEIRITNAEAGPTIVQTLQGLKDMLEGSGGLAFILQQYGADIHFRHVGTSIFIDFTYTGSNADKIVGLLSTINLSALNFSGSVDFHITNKFNLADILSDKAPLDILADLFNLKIEGQWEFFNLKVFFGFIIDTLISLSPSNKHRDIKLAGNVLKLLAASRSFGFNFTYDSNVIFDLVKSFLQETGQLFFLEAIGGEGRGKLNQGLEQLGMMAPMFLAPFADALKLVDFDHISVYGTCPGLTFNVKLSLMLRGLTQLIHEKILINI